jgi:hypothetical protein
MKFLWDRTLTIKIKILTMHITLKCSVLRNHALVSVVTKIM